jgi:hypothetical protein
MLMYAPTSFGLLLTSRSIAIEHLQKLSDDHNVAVLYVYFSERQTPSTILRTLLQQAVAQLDVMPSHISQMYESFTAAASDPDFSAWKENFKPCLTRFEIVYILFDAVDELSGDRQLTVINLIQELLIQSSVKILLTSRHAKPPRLPPPPMLVPLSVKARDHDIRTFLTTKLRDTDTYLSQDLKNEITKVISDNADGM